MISFCIRKELNRKKKLYYPEFQRKYQIRSDFVNKEPALKNQLITF